MPIVVGVAFKPLGKITPCDPGTLELALDEAVIVDGDAGLEFGFVRTPARAVPDEDAPAAGAAYYPPCSARRLGAARTR